MKITPFEIYCVLTADNVSVALCVAAILLFTILLVTATISFLEDDEVCRKVSKLCLAPFVLCFLGAVLVPDTKTLAAMYVVPAIADSKAIQQDVPEIYNRAVDRLKETLKPQAEKP